MQSGAKETPSWWLWPTILSLDAPAVVVLWQMALARAASVPLHPAETVVLACSVWLAYAADRWIEGWRLAPESVRTHRHRFHQRRRWTVAGIWIVVLAADLATAARCLPPYELRAGCSLLVAVVAYLLSHQLIHRKNRWRAPKEVCVAALLGAGTAIFVALKPDARVGVMAGPLAVFVSLGFANCALISVWENDVDRTHDQMSFALQFRRGEKFSRALPWVITVASAIAAASVGAQARPSVLCGAASALLLGLVDLSHMRIGRACARVLADVALMTPAVPAILGLLR